MLKKIAIRLLNIYQGYIRPALPCSCRFVPSCSEYTKQAISKYGLVLGACKGIKRLSLCHPFSKKSGYAPLV